MGHNIFPPLTQLFLKLIIRHPVDNYKMCTANNVPTSIVKNIVSFCFLFCPRFVSLINYTLIGVSAKYKICKCSSIFFVYPLPLFKAGIWRCYPSQCCFVLVYYGLNFKPCNSNISIMVHTLFETIFELAIPIEKTTCIMLYV